MLVKRLWVAIILLPIGLILISIGGIPFALLIALFMGLAAWEYDRLFRAGGFKPAGVLIPAGALLLLYGRFTTGFESAHWMISLVILVSMAYHLVAYERGVDTAGTDFGITLAGVLYFGWVGGYLMSLRDLPDGKWWFLIALPAVWLADSGAYFIGRKFGQHRLSPRLSPKKSWEGYLGGILFGSLGAALLTLLWRIGAGPESAVTVWRAALLGLVLSILTPLGDLGESMIKRQFGVKDSSNLFPGHGGAFDRIDSWLWAGVIGYYVIVWLFI
ncbi:MAG TPA: phosphatidate cytidylyltransferase [Anaerolineales bacterium]|nr:phosphatidate cytidylyltransferase [Anaerolineales bacterium]